MYPNLLKLRPGQREGFRLGAHTVEFALVLPIIFLLFFAGIEFARMTMVRHVVDNASYEAARHVIVPGATAEEAIDRAQKILASVGASNATIIISPNPITEETEEVSVQVTLPTAGNMLGLSAFSGGLSFRSETKLITERGPMQQIKAITGPPPPPPSCARTTRLPAALWKAARSPPASA